MNATPRRVLRSIDLLPPAADEAMAWALGQYADRRMTQTAIVKELNVRLADLGLGPITLSAFNRYVIARDPATDLRRSGVLTPALSAAITALIDQRLAALGIVPADALSPPPVSPRNRE